MIVNDSLIPLISLAKGLASFKQSLVNLFAGPAPCSGKAVSCQLSDCRFFLQRILTTDLSRRKTGEHRDENSKCSRPLKLDAFADSLWFGVGAYCNGRHRAFEWRHRAFESPLQVSCLTSGRMTSLSALPAGAKVAKEKPVLFQSVFLSFLLLFSAPLREAQSFSLAKIAKKN